MLQRTYSDLFTLLVEYLSHDLLLRFRVLLTRALVLLTAPVAVRPIQFFLRNLCLNQGTSIVLPASCIPPYQRRQQDRSHEHNCPVHVLARHGSDCGHKEDDTDKQGPGASPDVDDIAELAHVPRTRFELAEDDLAEDGNAIGPIQGDGSDVEDTCNRGVGTQADQVNGDAPEDADPDCVDWGTGAFVDLGPEL